MRRFRVLDVIERLDSRPMARACMMFKYEWEGLTVTAIIVPVKVSPQEDGGILIG